MRKRIVAVVSAVLIFALSFSFLCFAQSVPDHRLVPRMNDKAELIDSSTESELLSRLDSLSEELGFDIAIATVASTDGKDIEAFSDDYFDYNGFGVGDDKSGVVLVISMDPRVCYISASGEGTLYFDYDDCQNIIDDFYDDLKAGDYGSVFNTFIDDAESYINIGRSIASEGVVSYRIECMKYNWPLRIALPIAVGIILAFLTVWLLTRGLKSVSKKSNAADYQVAGSLSLSRCEEHFMYNNVVATPIPEDNSSDGTSFGSGGTHIGSSGGSHSGGGRSF